MELTRIKWLNRLYWLGSFLFLIYFIVLAAPKKGFDLSDHGIYTTSANNFLFGIFNEYGLSDLVNALLIKLGFGYLNMTRFFYFLEFFSGLLFLLSLKMQAKAYWVAPIAVTLMLASSPVHLLSYESAGAIFLMIGTSLLFFALNYSASKFLQTLLFALSAFFYNYSSVTNLLLTPSILINAIILFFIYPRIKSKTFIITYILTGMIALYLVIFKVLPIFEKTPFYHPDFFSWALKKTFIDLLVIIGFVLSGFIFTKLVFSFITFVAKLVNKFNRNFVNTLTITITTALLWIGLRIKAPHYHFGGWPNSLMLYGFIYLGVIFAIYGWRFYQHRILTLLMLALLLHTEYYLALAGPSGIIWSIRSLANASQICLIVLLCLEYYFILDTNNRWRKFLVTFILLLGMFYPIKEQLIYAFGENPLQDTQKVTDIPRLNGLYMPPTQLEGIRKIVSTYYQNNCKNKLFISRQILSLFYYVFNRIGYSPLYFLDSENDLKRLKQAENKKRGYCFMGDFIFEKASQSNDPKSMATQKLHQWLEAHSKHIIYLPIKGTCCVKNLYVKMYIG